MVNSDKVHGNVGISRRISGEKGSQGLRNVLRVYRHGANQRGISFNLTPEQFRALTSGDCAYCGAPPRMEAISIWQAQHYTPQFTEHAQYIYNGVDRVDNSRGYDPENCVPCCKTCNRMKHALGVEEFIEHVKAIYSYITSK
jgi:5-methylcytosine-specific restriction endonuclease McrA